MLERSTFVQESMDKRGNEVEYVRRIVNSLAERGDPVERVYGGDDPIKVEGVEDVLTVVFNLDGSWLVTRGGLTVFLVMGQFPDTVADYSLSLSSAIDPVVDWAYSR